MLQLLKIIHSQRYHFNLLIIKSWKCVRGGGHMKKNINKKQTKTTV